jgi:two-component system response regulator DevR
MKASTQSDPVSHIVGNSGLAQIRVFLLDDHEPVREALRELIGGEADMCIVGEAGTAAEAMRAIPMARPHVAVLDARLPDGSGIAVCRQVRAADPSIRALILTSYDDETALRAAVLANASGYFLKQIRGRALIEAIRCVARGEALLEAGTRAAGPGGPAST